MLARLKSVASQLGGFRYAITLAVAAVLIGGGIALAQDRTGEGAGGGQQEDAAVDVERGANLTAPEQVAEAERIGSRATQISRRVQQMLDAARRERDIMRVTCLNDKLTQVNANLRTAGARSDSLREAVQMNDDARRNHEFTVMTVLSQKFRTLEQEANQCVGQDIFETGTTRVETIIDPETPEEDPSTVNSFPEIPVPFIPPPASPVT
jgi:hypothetical protein